VKIHKPGHLREAFIDVVEHGENIAGIFYDGTTQARLEPMTSHEHTEWLAGQLWDCTDTMPSDTCSALDMPPGSTYAQAAQGIRRGDILPWTRLRPML